MLRAFLQIAGPIVLTLGLAARTSGSPDLASKIPARSPVPVESVLPIPADPPALPASTRPASTRPASTPATDVSDFLALLTGNNSAPVRRLGARQLLTLGSPDANEKLRQLLATPTDAAAVAAICDVLSQTGLTPPSLLAPLVDLLGDTRPGISELACRSLAAAQDGRVVSMVRDSARDKQHSLEQRLASIRCLGRLSQDREAVSALIEQADDASRSIQAAVLAAMNDVAQERFPTISDAKAWWSENRSVSESQWHRRNFGALQRRYVSAVSAQGELTQRVASLVRAEFLRTPEADRPKALLALLKDELPAVRELALDLVNTWITDRKEIGVEIRTRLGELIDDSEGGIRRRAAKMVGDLRLTAEASRLAGAIDRESDPDVRAALIDAAGRLDDRAFVMTLLPRLNDEAPVVVSATAGALANLARRGFGKSGDVEAVSAALGRRLAATPAGDELRVRLLTAMSVVGSDSLRTVIAGELDAGRPLPTRCAALRGLGAYRDARAAGEVRTWVDANEALLRLAAVEALGGCGGGDPDLTALFARLDPGRESSAPVREQAWESYKSVAARSPAATILAAADQFALDGSVADQERRIELLRIAAQRSDELSPVERVAVQERIGDARMAIGDFKSAVTAFEQAATGDDEATAESRPRLGLKVVDARLHAGDDDEAVAKLTALLTPSVSGEGGAGSMAGDVVLAELRRRLLANDLAGTIRLLDKCEPLGGRLGRPYSDEAARLRTETLALQGGVSDEEVDRLLAGAVDDPALMHSLTDMKVRTLARIHARLARPQTTSAATRPADTEPRLIALARRLAPDWRGFGEQATAAERSNALSELALQVRAAARSGSAGASTQPASASTSH